MVLHLVRHRLTRTAALVALALPLVGAAPRRQQETPPARDAIVEGIVVHQDGSPAPGVPVSMVGSDGPGPEGVIAAIFTLGLACLDRDLCAGDETTGDATASGASGRYQGTLPGAYVAGTETDTDWVVTAAAPPAAGEVQGPRSWFEFEVNIAVQSAPPLPLWDQTPSTSVDGWRVTASADTPPAGTDRNAVVIRGAGGGRVTVAGGTATVDVRRLEPVSPADQQLFAYGIAYADVRVPHANGRTIYHQAVATGTVPVPLVGLIPPSRGASCSLVNGDGTTVSAGEGTCRLTDGDRWAGATSEVTSATIRLRAPVDVAVVFVAGCFDDCLVEASADGVEWTPLSNGLTYDDPGIVPNGRVLVASSAAPQAARFVRLSRAGGFGNISEVSVWPAAPGPVTGVPAKSPIRVGPVDLVTDLPIRTGAAGGGVPWIPAAAAALALVGVAIGLGVVRARRQT